MLYQKRQADTAESLIREHQRTTSVDGRRRINGKPAKMSSYAGWSAMILASGNQLQN